MLDKNGCATSSPAESRCSGLYSKIETFKIHLSEHPTNQSFLKIHENQKKGIKVFYLPKQESRKD